METKCPICNSELQFLAGCPAHPRNMYCDICEYEAWDKDSIKKAERNMLSKQTNNRVKRQTKERL